MALNALKLRLKAVCDLAGGGSAGWTITGEDPQFRLHWSFGRTLAAGVYTVVAVNGRGLHALRRASLYIDTGAGFNETQRTPLVFAEREGRWFSRVRFDAPVRALRFDPSEGFDRPSFHVEALVLERSLAAAPFERLNDAPKVLLNLVRLLPGAGGAGGAGRVCVALIRELPNHVHLRVAASPDHAHLAAYHPNVEFIITPSDDAVAMAPHLQWCDCYIDPLNALRPKTIFADAAIVAILQDLQHMRAPHFFSAAERRARAAEYGYAAFRADRLIAISAYEQENLRRYYARADVSVVHYAGFMAEDSGLSKADRNARQTLAPADKRYLLYPAVPWLHKNHEILVQALAILRRRALDVPLALTNTRTRAGHGDRISILAASLGVDDLIERKAFLPESELLDLMMNATGMLFPSLYEGFGIPLADAMQLGTPALVARCAASPEICGDAVAYFSNPRNALAVANDIAAFWSDGAARDRLREAGLQRARQFSAARMGNAVAEAVAAAIAGKKARDGARERAVPAPAEAFAALSAFVIYRDLSETDLTTLRSVANINAFHTQMFGSATRVTCGLDIRYAADAQLAAVFAQAERLICFDAVKTGAEAFSVQDFSMRYDDAALHLVTHYPQCAKRYTPRQIEMLELSMKLHPEADYAKIEPGLHDVVLHGVPGEAEGVLAFEHRRRSGPIIADVIIRRDAISDTPHGTVAFLSRLVTRGRHLAVPEAPPRAPNPYADLIGR